MTTDMLTVLNDIPFSIPAYFALLARAVVTLEGLALTADPSYGLVVEAYPFVARKLLSSSTPQMQQALQQVLYSSDTTTLTPSRLASLLNSAAGMVGKKDGQVFVDLDAVPEEGLSPSQTFRLLLSSQASSLRPLLTSEASLAADLLLRQAIRKNARDLPLPWQLPGPLLLPQAGERRPRLVWTTPQAPCPSPPPHFTLLIPPFPPQLAPASHPQLFSLLPPLWSPSSR